MRVTAHALPGIDGQPVYRFADSRSGTFVGQSRRLALLRIPLDEQHVATTIAAGLVTPLAVMRRSRDTTWCVNDASPSVGILAQRRSNPWRIHPRLIGLMSGDDSRGGSAFADGAIANPRSSAHNGR
jgi:hypothetical protein